MNDLLCILCGRLGPPHVHGALPADELELARLTQLLLQATKPLGSMADHFARVVTERNAARAEVARLKPLEEAARALPHADEPPSPPDIWDAAALIERYEKQLTSEAHEWDDLCAERDSAQAGVRQQTVLIEFHSKAFERAAAERDSARAEVAALRMVADQLVTALERAADAISNTEGWHDELSDENGDETCEPGDPCDCELVRTVNNALSAAVAIRERGTK